MPKYIVRCGVMRTLHVMQSKSDHIRGALVIGRTSRGLENGEVLCEATDEVVAKMNDPSSGSIQREATSQDLHELNRLKETALDEFNTCRRLIQELKLNMDLIDVEIVFGGERVVVYYLSDDRIDFRELVKMLSSEFQTRVEMRQLGARDEAKLLADYGDCGKPVCCNTHLDKMPPVTMRMAKLQKPTLDPNKISGRCGRLKCCLRYEFDTYEEYQKDLPPIGSDIITSNGRGRVIQQEILSQQLLVEMEDRRRVLVPASDVLSVLKRGSDRRQEPNSDPSTLSDSNSVE
ncbi:MAG: regulatory iron-sulfur-containing complex subunit RicT [Pirellulaceae bacterium]|nr:regulatory iron-sulfur-containing complex subunit RicT [Pirellulaceae bacterium]